MFKIRRNLVLELLADKANGSGPVDNTSKLTSYNGIMIEKFHIMICEISEVIIEPDYDYENFKLLKELFIEEIINKYSTPSPIELISLRNDGIELEEILKNTIHLMQICSIEGNLYKTTEIVDNMFYIINKLEEKIIY